MTSGCKDYVRVPENIVKKVFHKLLANFLGVFLPALLWPLTLWGVCVDASADGIQNVNIVIIQISFHYAFWVLEKLKMLMTLPFIDIGNQIKNVFLNINQ